MCVHRSKRIDYWVSAGEPSLSLGVSSEALSCPLSHPDVFVFRRMSHHPFSCWNLSVSALQRTRFSVQAAEFTNPGIKVDHVSVYYSS